MSIALNSVSKYKVRVLPSVLEYIKEKNCEPKRLVFSLAALIAFYRTDAANDDKVVMEFMKTASAEDILKRRNIGVKICHFYFRLYKNILTKSKRTV